MDVGIPGPTDPAGDRLVGYPIIPEPGIDSPGAVPLLHGASRVIGNGAAPEIPSVTAKKTAVTGTPAGRNVSSALPKMLRWGISPDAGPLISVSLATTQNQTSPPKLSLMGPSKSFEQVLYHLCFPTFFSAS